MRHSLLAAGLALVAALGPVRADELVIRLDHLSVADALAIFGQPAALRSGPPEPLRSMASRLNILLFPATPPERQGVFPLPDGVTSLAGDAALAVLIATGSADGVHELARLIDDLDQPPARIEIEVRRLRIPRDQLTGTGLVWMDPLALPQTEPTLGGVAAGNMDQLIDALEREHAGARRERRTLMTLDGWPVSLTLSEQLPADERAALGRHVAAAAASATLAIVPRVTGLPPNESVTAGYLIEDARVTLYSGNPLAVVGEIRGAEAQRHLVKFRARSGETVALQPPVRRADAAPFPERGLVWAPVIGNAYATEPAPEVDLLFVTPRVLWSPATVFVPR